MPDGGLLLTLPAQSVMIRLLLGAIVAAVGARLLLRSGLRVPRVRVGAALAPAAAVVAILLVSVGDYRLPTLMSPGGDAGQVLLPLGNDYAFSNPLTLPFLLGTWAIVSASRIAWRLGRTWRLNRSTRRAVEAQEVPLAVLRSVRRVAARMGIDAPPVGLAAVPGGACVIGVRRPVVVIDPDLATRFDPRELEGVIAHELAHVRRRDNLVATVLSVIRDVVFFVPGGRWALRQLLVEREIAADQLAVQTTRRPGALAAGLLKVLDRAPMSPACAPLLPHGTLVERVEHLVDDRPAPGRVRTASELVAVSTVFGAVVLIAVVVPRMVAGTEAEGGLGVLLTTPQEPVAGDQPDAPDTEPRVFAAYRSSDRPAPFPTITAPVLDDDPDAVRPEMLAACATGSSTCLSPSAPPSTLPLRPDDTLGVQSTHAARWHAREVIEAGQMLRIYWLSVLD